MKEPKSKKKFTLCCCGILKTNCIKHSPLNFCNCGSLIANCDKCRIHRGICGCGKPRGVCATHGGYLLCSCGSGHHRSRCTKCGGGTKLCIHKRRVNNCMQCLRDAKNLGDATPYLTNTGEICACAKPRKFCLEHGGTHICTTCRLTSTKLKNTECSPCRRFRNGALPIKSREFALKSFIDTAVESGEIPAYDSHDRSVTLGLDPLLFGNNRPDFLWFAPYTPTHDFHPRPQPMVCTLNPNPWFAP